MGPMRPLLPLLLLAPLAGAQDAARREVERLAAELAGLDPEAGFQVDLARVEVRSGEPGASAEGLRRRQDACLGADHWLAREALRRATGEAARDPEERRRAALEAELRARAALFLPDPGVLVLFSGRAAADPDARDLAILRELVRAWQEQRHGVARLAEAGERTTDRAAVLSGLLEGQAEALARGVHLKRAGRSLREVDPESEPAPGGDPAAIARARGMAHALGAFRRGGWPALRGLLHAPLPSTEQLLHPEKLGRDKPRAVTLPPWPESAGRAERVAADVVGELALRALLLERGGLPPQQAELAAIGWDGDRLEVWRTPDGRLAVVWRLAWDRPQDAEQAAKALTGLWRGALERRGSELDCVWTGGHDALSTELLAALRAAPGPAGAEPEDAESTEQIELDRTGGAGADRWELPGVGLSLPIPAGWRKLERDGVAYLLAPPRDGFADNVNAMRVPNRAGKDAEALLRCVREDVEQYGLQVVRIQPREWDGAPAVLVEYAGQVPVPGPDGRQRDKPLHFLALAVGEESEMLLVTATTAEARWEERRAELEALLAGARPAAR